MVKTYYHATDPKNLFSILGRGILRGIDGQVYLAENPDEAVRFLSFRGIPDVLVIEVMLEESKVEESFDHNPNFFKCRAWMYGNDIPRDHMTNFWTYTIERWKQPPKKYGESKSP